MLRTSLRLVLPLALLAPPLGAQEAVSAMSQWEGRFVSALSPDPGALGGLGVNVRAGHYARLGVALTAGAVSDGDVWRAQQRVEATARFLLDPFGERRRAFYAGAGIGALRDEAGTVQGLLLGVVGIEGRRQGRVIPAIELTLGGGARLALVLRSARAQGR